MSEKYKVLKIIREDILRILGEKKGEVSIEFLEKEIKGVSSFVRQAIEMLKKGDSISIEDSIIKLTENGLIRAKEIVKKHLIIEEYFKKRRGEEEAHKIAHLLEHFISVEVINNIKKLATLKEEGIPLENFRLNREGLITDIPFYDHKLSERMISMGILPGESIKVTHKIPVGFIVKISNKKLVIDETIAKGIKVLKYEKF